MKSHKNKILCGVLIIVWLILFSNLTPIVLSLKSEDLSLSSVNLDKSGGKVNYWIDSLTINDNLFREVYVWGWAFIDTEEDNTYKNVKLILASGENVYEKNMDLFIKGGLAVALPNNIVPEYRTGVTTTFSPLGMENGDYALYIYVYENEDNVGIINTGRVFHKSYQSFFEIIGGQKLSNSDFAGARANPAVKYYIDECSVSGGKVQINGWAYLENTESSKNQIFLQIMKPDGTVSYYSTQKVSRVDVAEHFKDDRYASSGFRVELPPDAIGTGENLISVIIGTENRAAGEYAFTWDGNDNQH